MSARVEEGPRPREEYGEIGTRLVLPCEVPEQWSCVEDVLRRPVEKLADLDAVLTKLRAADPDRPQQASSFFATIPGSAEAGDFDFGLFFAKGLPLLLEVALDLPRLFNGIAVPVFKMRSSWSGPLSLGRKSFTLSRRQCASLLAHSFLGSLRRPPDVQRNDFRFTVVDLFVGTAVSPASATTFLNYFTMLGKHGIPDGELTFHRQGFLRGHPPWQWEQNVTPLCEVEFVIGSIEYSPADLHVEFANAFVGGGVMTGDAAMEEVLFLVKPELMVAMALENRMVDEEAVSISGAVQYSMTGGYGVSLRFAGDYDQRRSGVPPKVCAIDAVRGGSSLERRSLLRDLNKARIAFDGATEIATGHWGGGAYGNNEDLMFLKQWMAASEAGVQKMYYHDHDKKHSHHIIPLERKLRHMTVGQLWDVISSIEPCTVSAFCTWVAGASCGRVKVPGAASAAARPAKAPLAAVGGGAPVAAQPLAPPGEAAPAPQQEEASSLVGRKVLDWGQDMACIKQRAAQLRQQREDGTATWASRKDITLR